MENNSISGARKLYGGDIKKEPVKRKKYSNTKSKIYQEMKKKKAQDKKEKRINFLKYTVLLTIFFGMISITIIRASIIYEKNLELGKAKKKVEELQKENAQLTFNLQNSSSILTIEEDARNILGMSKLNTAQIKKIPIIRHDFVERLDSNIIKNKEKTFIQILVNKLFEII